jgi:hypothetical protein
MIPSNCLGKESGSRHCIDDYYSCPCKDDAKELELIVCALTCSPLLRHIIPHRGLEKDLESITKEKELQMLGQDNDGCLGVRIPRLR